MTPVAVAALMVAGLIAAPEALARRSRTLPPPDWSAPVPEPRPRAAGPSAAEPDDPAPAPPATAPSPAPDASPSRQTGPAPPPAEAAACRTRLAALGARFSPAEPPRTAAPCGIDDPVTIESLAADGHRITLPDRPLLACSFALVLATYVRDGLAPLAQGHAGARLSAFGTGPGFACRPRNRVAGARLSAHGRGEAIDIAWLVLEGGERVVVGQSAAEGDRGPRDKSLRLVTAIRRAACGWFTTVLGPGSDAAHADHLHFDLERRGRSGDHRLCQ